MWNLKINFILELLLERILGVFCEFLGLLLRGVEFGIIGLGLNFVLVFEILNEIFICICF